MKRAVFTVVVLSTAGVAFWAWQGSRPVVEPPTIVRAPVSRGAVTETVRAVGTLQPIRRVNVGSQVSGTVKEMYADFNSVVKEGQLLAEIDSSLLELRVEVQQASIDRQKADIATQEVQLENQRRQFERVANMHESGLQNEQQLDAAVLAVKNREAQITSARTQLVQAEASLEAAKLNVSYAKIYAPIDGVVIQRRVSVGQAVQAAVNTPSFFMLSTPLQVLKLTAGVDEADVGRVRPGMEVRFRVGAYGAEEFTGIVEAVRLNAGVSNSVVTYPVWIHVPNDDLRLRPSMTAEVFIQVAQTREVVRIPNEALRFRPSRALYDALGAPPPAGDEVTRAVDRMGDRIVDPAALREMAVDDDDEAETIDELFAPLPRADSRATVWTWDEATRRFTPITVRVGVTDGTVSELLEGDVRTGDELVTGFVLPVAPAARPARSPLLGNQRRVR